MFFVNYILFQYYANMRSYCIVRLYFVFVMCTCLCAGYNFRNVFENLEATKLHSCGIINALFDSPNAVYARILLIARIFVPHWPGPARAYSEVSASFKIMLRPSNEVCTSSLHCNSYQVSSFLNNSCRHNSTLQGVNIHQS